MRNFIILAFVVVALGYVATGVGKMYTVRGKFQDRVDYHLGLVTEKNFESVRQSLVREAGELGLRLAPGDVRISYGDAERTTLPQTIVGTRLGTQFVNKRATIECRVVAPVVGIGIAHQLRRSRLIQVKAVQPRGQSELETMMDAAPPF